MDLENKSRDELRTIAREAGLTGYGKMGAKDLRVWLEKNLGKTPVPPVVEDDPLVEIEAREPRKPFSNCIDYVNRLIAKVNGKK